MVGVQGFEGQPIELPHRAVSMHIVLSQGFEACCAKLRTFVIELYVVPYGSLVGRSHEDTFGAAEAPGAFILARAQNYIHASLCAMTSNPEMHMAFSFWQRS